MFYEYRRYDVVHGRMEELKTRFTESTIPMWKESGIEPVAFFEPRIGNPNILHYLLKWDDLGSREETWEAFRVKPELAVQGGAFDDPESDAALMEGIDDSTSGPAVDVTVLDTHINDLDFASEAADRLLTMLGG